MELFVAYKSVKALSKISSPSLDARHHVRGQHGGAGASPHTPPSRTQSSSPLPPNSMVKKAWKRGASSDISQSVPEKAGDVRATVERNRCLASQLVDSSPFRRRARADAMPRLRRSPLDDRNKNNPSSRCDGTSSDKGSSGVRDDEGKDGNKSGSGASASSLDRVASLAVTSMDSRGMLVEGEPQENVGLAETTDWSPARILSSLFSRRTSERRSEVEASNLERERVGQTFSTMDLDGVFLVSKPLRNPLKDPTARRLRARVSGLTSKADAHSGSNANKDETLDKREGPAEVEVRRPTDHTQPCAPDGGVAFPQMSFSACLSPTSTSDRVALSDKPDPYFVLNPDMFDDAALWTAPRLQSLCEVLGLDPGAHSFSRRGRRGSSREELVRCLRDFHRNRWHVDRRRGEKNSRLTGTEARPEESQEGSNFFLVPVDFVDIPQECVKVFSGGTGDGGGAKRSRSILKYSCSSRRPRSDNSSSRSVSETTYMTSKARETKEQQRTRKRKRSAVDAAEDDTEKLPSNKRIRFSAFNNVQLIDPRPDGTESTEWVFKLPFGCAKRE